MSLVNFPGQGPVCIENPFSIGGTPVLLTTGVIDASTEKFAVLGQIFHETKKTGTINIRKIEWRGGAITLNTASTLRLSLQNVSLTAGPPYQPDGVQDQTFDYIGSTNPPTANAWNTTGNLSADRAVDLTANNVSDANSTWVAVVFEYQTFTAADSVIISGVNRNITSGTPIPDVNFQGYCLLNTGTWGTVAGGGPIIAFECDDGTKAFMVGAAPYTSVSTVLVANNAAVRAAGLKFSFPFECSIEDIGLLLTIPNGCDGTLVLYDSDGTTVLKSYTLDNDAVASTTARMGYIKPGQQTISANGGQRLVFVASTTNAASVHYATLNSSALLAGCSGGTTHMWTQRDSGGTWTDTATQRPFSFIRLSAVHDGSGSGGGGLRVAGHGGLAA
jgi:hypothetical protein